MQLNPIQEKQFNCCACGSCCSNLRGILPKEEKEFMQEYAYGKMPLIQLVPLEQMTFPLWDWEAKRFFKWADERNIESKIKHSRAILDLNSNTAIIVTYFIDSHACTFLSKDGKCRIYDKERAYICRLFPFNRSPFLKTEKFNDAKELFGSCHSMENILPCIPKDFDKMINFFNKAFPDKSFENTVQHDIVIEWVNKTIIDLIKKRAIRPAMNYPYNFLLKRLHNAEKIDFTDFLVKSNYFSREEMDTLIKKFDNNMDAKEKIKEFIENN